VHIVPEDDLVQHDLNRDCVCGPTIERFLRADGTVGGLALHHALGLEVDEPISPA